LFFLTWRASPRQEKTNYAILGQEKSMTSTILIVDDESAGRETLEAILEGEGYLLRMAENGRQALEMAREFPPDVILLDVMMPGMTGFEVCKVIRNDEKLAEVPIIIVTALDDRQALLEGLSGGADDFITKPYDRYELRARLSSITRLNRYRKILIEHQNFELAHQQLMTAYEATIEGWSRAMDLRDRETEGHSRRVTQMTLQLADVMGIGEKDLVYIRYGSLLHDMGKLGIPDAILHKPGRLTEDEWEIMRQHPQLGRDLLIPIEYLRPALDIPYCHHEKWNGAGYPRGLKGTEIPLAARLFTVVDVWDALLSDRPYRRAWNREEVVTYLKEESGKSFDPLVVDLFLKTFVEGNR
jgi:putative two-component system response regulator